MNANRAAMLGEEMQHLQLAASHLQYSLDRSLALMGKANWTPEELERLESLSSRFARLSDLLTQRIMRLVDEIELTPEGSLLDRINRAEKRGWSDQANRLVEIRELRNIIAHEYEAEKLPEIYQAAIASTPHLLAVIPKVIAYCQRLMNA